MKKIRSQKPIAATLIFLFFLNGCYVFDFVNQPYAADPNSFFNVQISITYNEPFGGAGELSYFGILLPNGWDTADSIEYFNATTNETGVMKYSDSLTQQMSSIDPPPLDYHWWVGMDSFSAKEDATFISELKIYTDSQTGTFFIDYMLGDNFNGLNYKRSNDHLIIAGDPVGCFRR